MTEIFKNSEHDESEIQELVEKEFPYALCYNRIMYWIFVFKINRWISYLLLSFILEKDPEEYSYLVLAGDNPLDPIDTTVTIVHEAFTNYKNNDFEELAGEFYFVSIPASYKQVNNVILVI
jgi:hypothetical protein